MYFAEAGSLSRQEETSLWGKNRYILQQTTGRQSRTGQKGKENHGKLFTWDLPGNTLRVFHRGAREHGKKKLKKNGAQGRNRGK